MRTFMKKTRWKYLTIVLSKSLPQACMGGDLFAHLVV